MKFLRNLLASVLGTLIALCIIFTMLVLSVFVMASMSLSSGKEYTLVENNSILTLDLGIPIQDRVSDNPLDSFDPMDFMFDRGKRFAKQGLNDILSSIKKAKGDKKIKGIVLKSSEVNSNFGAGAVVTNIRQALKDFKTSGKFIYAYNNYGYSQKGYWLVSIADSVFLNPQSTITFSGFGGSMIFLTNTLKKLGVKPEIIRHGKYKAAVEQYMLQKMSSENRKQTMKYVSSIWNKCLKDISDSRGITINKLNSLADNLTVRSPKTALKEGFVDKLLYEDEFEEFLKNKLSIKPKDDINFVQLNSYKNAINIDNIKLKTANSVAIIYASGEIVGEGHNGITPDIIKTIKDVKNNNNIKSVVLRINSPGGSAIVSDIILRELKLLKAVKPLVVSFGNVAASGGYYIACAADTIVAEPTTITGSIGVFALIFNMKELVENKLGISMDYYGTNKYSSLMTRSSMLTRGLTPFVRNIIQRHVEDIYDTFISHVSEARGLTKEQVDKIGQGRVWIGEDAKKNGLVDELGGLFDAVEIAKKMSGIDGPLQIVEYPKYKDPFTKILSYFQGDVKTKLLKSKFGENYFYYQAAKKMFSREGIQAILPYELSVE